MSRKYSSLSPARAIDLFDRLLEARQLYLQPALSRAVASVGVATIDRELLEVADSTALTRVAALGIRGERVFPTPSILREMPSLIAYYRMLLGLSQKEFGDSAKYGYGRFVRAEKTGRLTEALNSEIPKLCSVFAKALAGLVLELDRFDDKDLHELTLLTMGPTLQGGRNVQIGLAATQGVFRVVQDILAPNRDEVADNCIRITNAAGRRVEVTFAADPDVRFDEELGGRVEPVLAIEIKGGTDRSNAHNRAGEAEKSHLKAKEIGYQHRWTVMSLVGVKVDSVRAESPSTTRFFDITQVLAQNGSQYNEFRRQIARLLGLPLVE